MAEADAVKGGYNSSEFIITPLRVFFTKMQQIWQQTTKETENNRKRNHRIEIAIRHLRKIPIPLCD
ncbi:hypothetical protein SD81_039455 [Tolypothrix campylonemoides VB511288]|nr:hypothetical protein SD81_039455 [Tolypothrix campylonemoides VB511288]